MVELSIALGKTLSSFPQTLVCTFPGLRYLKPSNVFAPRSVKSKVKTVSGPPPGDFVFEPEIEGQTWQLS